MNDHDMNPSTDEHQPQYPVGLVHDLKLFCKGLLMGSADAVPGVSGGTVALIVGIYERLVRAVSRFDQQFVKLVLGFRLKAAFNHIDGRFLTVLMMGIILAILAVASTMKFLLENHRQSILAVFFGLIVASSILVIRRTKLTCWRDAVPLLAGGIFAFWLVGQPVLAGNHSPVYLFFCAMIAICAMILPGISGSYILLILGEYEYVVGIVKGFVHHLIKGQMADAFMGSEIVILLVFASGCVIGLISFTKLLRWLLARYEHVTLLVLCGFMVGSLRSLWPFQEKMTMPNDVVQYANTLPGSAQAALSAVVLCLASAVALLLLEYIVARLEGKKAD